MDTRVLKLVKRPQLKQLSPEWFAARPSLVTASSAAALLIKDDLTCDSYINEYKIQDIFLKDKKCCNPYSSKKQYFTDKCIGSKFKGSVATYWGQKYEEVASNIYSVKMSREVMEFGLLLHPDLPWLAASPDGITPDGIMLEIKCPYRRTITGIPPFYYWIQCQLQLEVTDLEFCDFAEYEFVEFVSEEEWLDNETLDTKFLHQGLFIQIEEKNKDNLYLPEKNQYIYPHKNYIDNTKVLSDWSKTQMESLMTSIKPEFEGKLRFSIVYWKLATISIVRIKRDIEWFKNAKIVFEKEYKKLAYYKSGDNYKKLITEKKKHIDGSVINMNFNDDCFLSDDEN